jgi:hypothetical protein
MKKMVDTTALKFNQGSIIALALLAFVFDWPWMVIFVGLVLAVGTAWPTAALFKLVYFRLLKPIRILRPQIVPDDPAPHQFAQGLGATCLLTSGVLLLLGYSLAGWLLTWMVVILASVNLFFNFCAGCFIFFQLDKAGLMSFARGE